MIGINYQQLPSYVTHRIGPLLLLIGFISIAQAAGLFPLGSAKYSSALITMALGGILTLGIVSKDSRLAAVGQGVLAVCAACLIIVF